MYRPTVRADDAFGEYVEEVFHATVNDCDRAKIIRLMLFAAPFSALYQDRLREQIKHTSPLPSPSWTMRDDGIWINQEWDRRGGSDANGKGVITIGLASAAF